MLNLMSPCWRSSGAAGLAGVRGARSGDWGSACAGPAQGARGRPRISPLRPLASSPLGPRQPAAGGSCRSQKGPAATRSRRRRSSSCPCPSRGRRSAAPVPGRGGSARQAPRAPRPPRSLGSPWRPGGCPPRGGRVAGELARAARELPSASPLQNHNPTAPPGRLGARGPPGPGRSGAARGRRSPSRSSC